MHLKIYTSAREFYAESSDFLMRDEVANNLPFAVVLAHLERKPNALDPYFAQVTDNGRIVAAAARTPPRRLLLAAGESNAMEFVAENCLKSYREGLFPGVNGPLALALKFAEVWRDLTGRKFTLRRRLQWYRLDEPPPDAKVSGRLRVANRCDRELLRSWVAPQIEEAQGPGGEAIAGMLVDAGIPRGRFFLWEDEAPVSMAMISRSTPNGSCISMVFTPPEFRRRGYAGACVAAVCRELLCGGRRFCFLSADLANSGTLRIYRDLGFSTVGESGEFDFLDR